MNFDAPRIDQMRAYGFLALIRAQGGNNALAHKHLCLYHDLVVNGEFYHCETLVDGTSSLILDGVESSRTSTHPWLPILNNEAASAFAISRMLDLRERVSAAGPVLADARKACWIIWLIVGRLGNHSS